MSLDFQNPLHGWLASSGCVAEPAETEDDRAVRRTSTFLEPARPVAKSSNQTVTGFFAKEDHSVVLIESGLELAYAEILDADPRVTDFRTQAPPLDYEHLGRRRLTFSDFEIDLVDGRKVFAAVKPKVRHASSGIRDRIAKVAERHGTPDRAFIVVDEDHLADHQVRNARLVNRALREDPDAAAEADRRVLADLASSDVPRQVVDVQIDLDLDGRTLTSVARLVRLGAVRMVVEGELTVATFVTATDAGRRRAAAEAADPERAVVGNAA